MGPITSPRARWRPVLVIDEAQEALTAADAAANAKKEDPNGR